MSVQTADTGLDSKLWSGRRRALRRNLTAFFFLLPTFLFLAIFMYQPTVNVIYHSFFRWDGFTVERYIGFGNFTKMVSDPNMHIATRNLGWFFLGWMLQRISPFLVAELVFNLRRERTKYWYRTLFVLPMVVPFLVTIMIWKFIYNPLPTIGVLNRMLGSFGLEEWQTAWLSEPRLVIPALLLVSFPWISGWPFMIFYAGLQQIPSEVLDASVMDGCNVWQRMFRIDIPLVVTSIQLVAIQTMIGIIQDFAFVLIMTAGGPAKASLVPGLLLFMAAFRGDHMGYGATIGVTMFIAIFILTLLSFRYTTSPFARTRRTRET